MLHPDSEKRIEEINRLAELFESNGYKKTSVEIKSFIEILRKEKVPDDFLKHLDKLMDTFETEFSEYLPVCKAYRQNCASEIRQVIIGAIGRMKSDFAPSYMQLYSTVVNLKHGRKIMGDIADELAQNKELSDKGKLHLYCFSYLILVEGVFDEVARILYFLKTVTPAKVPIAQELERINVWDVYNELDPKPIFLDNWVEKKRIRNAIGHATFYYDSEKQEIQFVDKQADYDRTLTLNRFMEKAAELESCVEAYADFTLLLRLYDLIINPNPF